MADRTGAVGANSARIMLSVCLAGLAACSDKTPPAAPPAAAAPAAPAAQRLDDVLMTAVFGQKYQASGREAVAELTDSQQNKASYRLQPVQHTVLATGVTVLLARALRQGADATGVQSGWLAVYYLRQEQGKWQVLARHDTLIELDRNSDFKASWIKPGKGKEGMALLYWHKGEKECHEEKLALFDFASSDVLPVSTEEIPVRSLATDECTWTYPDSRWSIASTWELVPTKGSGPYHDLVLTFSGEITRPPRDDAGQLIGPPVKTPVSGQARYKFHDGQFEFDVEGENPIPQDSTQYG